MDSEWLQGATMFLNYKGLQMVSSHLLTWVFRYERMHVESVLYVVPIYYFSFFKAHEGVITTIETLFRRFLWCGVKGVENFIGWLGLKFVRKSEGGLGLKNLKAFNYALLGKWLWRLRTEPVKVMEGMLKVGGRWDSGGVRDLCKLELEGNGFKQNWFSAAIKKAVGDGTTTSFWHDSWLDVGPLKEKVGRLLLLNLDKEGLVANLVCWRNGVGECKWRWRRTLFQREEAQLTELQSMVLNVGLKGEGNDRWVWLKDSNGFYSTRSAYN